MTHATRFKNKSKFAQDHELKKIQQQKNSNRNNKKTTKMLKFHVNREIVKPAHPIHLLFKFFFFFFFQSHYFKFK